jgi:hypothetical protein
MPIKMYTISKETRDHGKFAQMYIFGDSGKMIHISVFKKAAKMKAPYKWCVETYSGENYIPGSHERSYSRMYPEGKGLPAKYATHVAKLKAALNIN